MDSFWGSRLRFQKNLIQIKGLLASFFLKQSDFHGSNGTCHCHLNDLSGLNDLNNLHGLSFFNVLNEVLPLKIRKTAIFGTLDLDDLRGRIWGHPILLNWGCWTALKHCHDLKKTLPSMFLAPQISYMRSQCWRQWRPASQWPWPDAWSEEATCKVSTS